MPKYRKPQKDQIDPYKSQPLPLGRPIAVYYRQSSEGQVGNISTTLQTVDMVEHLIAQGWQRDQIIMIDMDAGVSGTKRIRERKGMSYLYDLIIAGEIGLVASQDVDRFFRDMAQIETNIFIDACRRSNVQVLTPTFVYDFAHPSQGRYHIQMFRDQVQRAADYLELFIKGRLWKSRQYLNLQGQWTGTPTALGYIVDTREKIDKSPNLNYRRYARFEPHASIVVAYFKLYKKFNGNVRQTWQHIEQHGPFIPEFETTPIPEGYFFYTNISHRSRHTSKLMLSHYAFRQMLTNAVYLGHWAHMGVIVQPHNHEAIIPADLFMYAFNRLSPVTFEGDPNPEYVPQRPWVRHEKSARPVPPPTYSGVVFSSDTPNQTERRMSSHWETDRKVYVYALFSDAKKIYEITTRLVDDAVDEMLLERLNATTLDARNWDEALSSTVQSAHLELRRLEYAIRSEEDAQRAIIENLKSVAHPLVIKQLEDRFVASEQEVVRLQLELEQKRTAKGQHKMLLDARPVLEQVIRHWNAVQPAARRELFDSFAERIMVTRLDQIHRRIQVYWRDGSTSVRTFKNRQQYFSWSESELEKLRLMVENHADQAEILRAFPGVSWRAIRERYGYHFGRGKWRVIYQGKVKHGAHARWDDLESPHSSGELAQTFASSNSSYP